MARDDVIDDLYREAEELIQQSLARQSPMAADLRFLVSVMRIVPELERSHDLAEHIARRAVRGLTSGLSPRVRGLLEQMGRVGVEMWRGAPPPPLGRGGTAGREAGQRPRATGRG